MARVFAKSFAGQQRYFTSLLNPLNLVRSWGPGAPPPAWRQEFSAEDVAGAVDLSVRSEGHIGA